MTRHGDTDGHSHLERLCLSRRQVVASLAAAGVTGALPTLPLLAQPRPAGKVFDFHHHFNPPALANETCADLGSM